ncbi:hypothetical protein RM549_10655 [Salegentibacter sp. F188]|uniref:40-residue YVTN family beta-propeller repeat-containing protein n=1 Tax=Autumnicola patrickiae TaxID=3075591 RepID=A0ABU3E2Q6_9FLAO|nr:DUF5074 domain-containing protein [Salegentibacter sp. F188]MDT0690246.1 hypothetical protein [Salegentibacter sp. F188]
MKINKFFIAALAAFTFLTSCESDDEFMTTGEEQEEEIIDPDPVEEEEEEEPEEEEPAGAYTSGIFILNEGNFGAGNSTVSFLNAEMDNITNNIFAEVNADAVLGDTGQSIAFYEDHAFIVLNVSNTIEIVDRNTFESVATISEGLENPRYVAFANGNAYVTNWGDGSNAEDDYVAVIDMETYEITENIAVVEGPERIVENDGNLYVAHLGGYSFNDKVSVINAADNTVSETITVGDRPNSLEIEDDFLWISTGGLPSYAEAETAGKIVKIDLNSNEIVAEMEFANNTDHPGNLDIEDDMIYYTLGKNVYTFSEEATTLPESAFAEMAEVASLYGFEVEDGIIYAASANSDFTGNGDLYLYNTSDGSLLNSFEVGINPNGIYFND